PDRRIAYPWAESTEGPERAMTDVVERTETAAQRLLDATQAILPLVRASGDEGERLRQLPSQVAQAMAEAGVARMLAPRSVGGLEIDPMTQLDVIHMLARAERSAGWNAQVYSSCGQLTGHLPAEVGQEIFGRNPSAVMSGTLAAPYGRAVVVPGGFRVSGR